MGGFCTLIYTVKSPIATSDRTNTAIILAVIQVSFFLWAVWWVGRGIFRRLFFKRIVARHTRKQDSKPVQGMVAAQVQNATAKFAELANSASMNDLRELKYRGDVADHSGRVAVFPGYAKNHPRDARAQYLNGCYLVRKAWAARGTGTADTISDADAEKFHDHLSDGQDALRSAIELDSTMPDAYAEWMGSDEQVLEFARTYGNSDTSGNLACLIPFALLEIWYSSDIDIGKYFKDRNIRKEVKTAFKLYINSTDDGEQVQACLDGLQYFACAFGMMGEKSYGKKSIQKNERPILQCFYPGLRSVI